MSIVTVSPPKEMLVVDHPSSPQDADQNDDGFAPVSPVGTPRWIKVFALIVLAVLVVFVVVLLASGHNPNSGRH